MDRSEPGCGSRQADTEHTLFTTSLLRSPYFMVSHSLRLLPDTIPLTTIPVHQPEVGEQFRY